jgi:molybdate transport system substrate-binding protein
MTVGAFRRGRIGSARIFAALAGAWLAFGPAVHAAAAGVTVFGAASLKEALDEQAKGFSTVSGHRVIASYAASNALARQIDAGAPADVVVLADRDWMDDLEKRGRLVANSRVDLLHGERVVIAPRGSALTLKIAPGMPLASALGNEKLAMANPDSVPAGKYARQALERLAVWEAVEKRVARTENVRVALALVARGEAPLGIVYSTDALADARVRVVDTFPADSHAPIVYPAALVAGRSSPAAGPFLDYLRSPAARGVWERHGFTVH